MKKLLFLVAFALCLCSLPATAAAQAQRQVVLTWTASTSTSVTGYNVFRCSVPSGGTTCTPVLTGTPLGSASGTTFTDTVAVQTTYGYSVVATAPPCSLTTPNTTPCGSSTPATLTAVPVPPQTAGAQNLIVVVP